MQESHCPTPLCSRQSRRCLLLWGKLSFALISKRQFLMQAQTILMIWGLRVREPTSLSSIQGSKLVTHFQPAKLPSKRVSQVSVQMGKPKCTVLARQYRCIGMEPMLQESSLERIKTFMEQLLMQKSLRSIFLTRVVVLQTTTWQKPWRTSFRSLATTTLPQ